MKCPVIVHITLHYSKRTGLIKLFVFYKNGLILPKVVAIIPVIIFLVGDRSDASQIQLLFQELGFFVREYVNLNVAKMRRVFQEEASTNHSAYSAFGACILTRRGNTENTFWGTDKTMEIDQLVDIIAGSESLRFKPKLLIIHYFKGNLFLIF